MILPIEHSVLLLLQLQGVRDEKLSRKRSPTIIFSAGSPVRSTMTDTDDGLILTPSGGR